MFKKLFLLIVVPLSSMNAMVIVTASDVHYFNHLLNLIGSIHRVDFHALQEIAVYDLGMSNEQKEQLSKIEKVGIYQVEQVRPDIIKPKLMDSEGKMVPGLYAWKPVIIKQELDKHDTILYLDAGNTVLHSLQTLFKHIEQNGYFLISVYHSVGWGAIKYVLNNLHMHAPERQSILEKTSISANIIGCSKKMYESFALRVYECCFDRGYFTDDGSAGWFGRCRYDQTLWSIFAYLNGMSVNAPSWSSLQVDGAPVPFHSNCYYEMENAPSSYWLNSATTIYQSRADYDLCIGAVHCGLPVKQAGEPYFKDHIVYR